MKNIIIYFLFILFFMTSCNPELHIIGSGMRYHNLSQNKYQPNEHRKKVKMGRNDNSPLFIFLRRR